MSELPKDYQTPLGMSRFSFNSLIRKRALDDLITRLVEQGRVRPRTSSQKGVELSENAASQQAEPVGEAANIFEESPPATAVNAACAVMPTICAPPRAASSVYSRDIDGNSIRSASVSQPRPERGSNRRDSIVEEPELEAEAMALQTSNDGDSSNRTSSSSAAHTSPTTATSASIHEGHPGGVIAQEAPATAAAAISPIGDLVKKGLRTLSIFSNRRRRYSSEASIQKEKTEARGLPQQHFDLQTAMTALQQQFENAEPQHGYPIIDWIVQTSRLRRKIPSLDFERDERILVASDLTSIVPLPKPRKPLPGERPDPKETRVAVEQVRFFRARLAKRVHRRIAFLRLQSRGGSVRQLEDWYREVGDIVGWRELEEAAMEWGWRENDGFF